MVYLQKLHAKYANKGLVVLGFNSADKHSIALKLMRKLELAFPCIVDSSSAAQQTAMQQYCSSAVPTTYVIDREGKVLMAWVGFSEKDENTQAALKKLGFE